MPIVNYVREHTRFMEYATDEHLTASERLLWYALMHIMNQRAQGNVWPDGFIRVSNDRLLSYCPMKFDTMAAARNSLKQRGLIEVEKGEKNKKSPAYRMIYFYPRYLAPDTERDGEGYPKNSDYMGGNMGDNTGGNLGGNPGDNMGDTIVNYKTYTEQERKGSPEEDEETDNRNLLVMAGQVEKCWLRAFGRLPTVYMADSIAQWGKTYGMSLDLIREGIQMTALRNPDSPIDYLHQLFRDWNNRNIRDLDQLDMYLEGIED